MLQKKSKVVPDGNGPVLMLGGIALEELRRVMSETMDKAFGEIKDDLRRINQRLASLDQNDWQPRLAMEVHVTSDKKIRECTENAAAAVQVKHGDICSAKKGPSRPEKFDLLRHKS